LEKAIIILEEGWPEQGRNDVAFRLKRHGPVDLESYVLVCTAYLGERKAETFVKTF
jgi:hypothetical protein